MTGKSMLERLNGTRPMIVSAKYEVTIPAEIREHLGIKPKDRVQFEVAEDGFVRLARVDANVA